MSAIGTILRIRRSRIDADSAPLVRDIHDPFEAFKRWHLELQDQSASSTPSRCERCECEMVHFDRLGVMVDVQSKSCAGRVAGFAAHQSVAGTF
jgi:hypothetical protein